MVVVVPILEDLVVGEAPQVLALHRVPEPTLLLSVMVLLLLLLRCHHPHLPHEVVLGGRGRGQLGARLLVILLLLVLLLALGVVLEYTEAGENTSGVKF